MIYVHRHQHLWNPTQRKLHGEIIYVCVACGDQAYSVDPVRCVVKAPKGNVQIGARATDFPLAA